MATALSARFRFPLLRSAQFTAFLTKLRSSPAAASMSGSHRDEARITGLFIMHSQQRKGRTAYKLFISLSPLEYFAPSQRRRPKGTATHLVTHIPRCEALDPVVHLTGRQLGRLSQHARHDAGFWCAGMAPFLENTSIAVQIGLCKLDVAPTSCLHQHGGDPVTLDY